MGTNIREEELVKKKKEKENKMKKKKKKNLTDLLFISHPNHFP